MKTAIVILNWNTRDLLEKYLPPLIESVKGADAQVIVADNASTDGSREMLRERFPGTMTIVLDKNYGFTGGYNKALATLEAEYYILINSDIEVTEGWFLPLEKWMDSHPECGACAPKLHSSIERDKFEYAGAAGGYIDKYGFPFCRGRIMKMTETDRGQYDSDHSVFWASGACLMVRSGLFRQLNGLDDRFFAHMEEIDLCWRMQLCGYTVNVVTDSMVYHIGGATLPQSSPFKLYLNFRNNLLMLCNNLAKTYALQEFRKGKTAEKAARKGTRKAARRIKERMTIDLLAGIGYLMMFRKESFRAVVRAHRDFRRMRRTESPQSVAGYLTSLPRQENIRIRGMYGKSILLQSLIKGKRIFKSRIKVS